MITLRFATNSLGSLCRTRTRLTTRLLSSSTESSSSSSSSSSGVVAKESSAMLEGTDTASLGTTIIRHGHGDRVITLNVGGKEFLTLRSTVNANAVLADHVARAEANREITKSGAVFIDRDPKYFDVILLHLRNRVEQLPTVGSKSNNSWMALTHSSLNLPAKADDNLLRELYIEATYYKIPELQAALTENRLLAKFFRLFGGTNPFDSVNQTLARARNLLLTLTTLSATGITIAVQRDFDAFLKFIGWRKEDDADGSKSSLSSGAKPSPA